MEEKKDKDNLPRLIAVDFARGFGLFIILIIHLYNFWALEHFFPEEKVITDQATWVKVLTFPFLFLGSWASAFAFITGISSAYIMHYQILEKNINLSKRLRKTIMNSFILLGINLIYIYFFIYPSVNIQGIEQRGLVPNSINEGKFAPPSLSILYMASPLSMIAFSNLFIVLVCALMWKNGVKREKSKKYIRIFGILGAISVLVARNVSNVLVPIMESQYEQGNYISSMLLAWLVGPKLSIFPYVGFAFFGAMIAIYMRDDNPDFKRMTRTGIFIGTIAIIIAFVDSLIGGFPTFEELYGDYFPFFTYILNLGVQMYLAIFCLNYWDKIPWEERPNYPRFRRIISFQRMSIISLTLFMSEQVTAGLYTSIFLIGGTSPLDNMYFLMIFYGPVYMYIMLTLINFWEKKYQLRYGVEWNLECLLRKKKWTTPEDLLNTEKIIYISTGYKSRNGFYELKELRNQK